VKPAAKADALPPGLHFGLLVSAIRCRQGARPRRAFRRDRPAWSPPAARRSRPNASSAKSSTATGFQDARKFLRGGGEKGRQLALLTAGTYRINPALFQIITAENAEHHRHGAAAQLTITQIKSDMVGIVTTLDGRPIESGEIAGVLIHDHDNFQNAQSFITDGGRRGLQEQVLLSGSWNLNHVVRARLNRSRCSTSPSAPSASSSPSSASPTRTSAARPSNTATSSTSATRAYGSQPLSPGKHPINTRVMRVELVPTTNIVLNWANRTEAHHFDDKLSSITVRSKDGFAFNLDVSQIIHVGALDAPKVISRLGSMQNLVDHALQPIVGNYFRNSAQHHTVLDFLNARSDRQVEAAAHIRTALAAYDVQAIDTLIGDACTPPAELMKTQTDRKIAEEEKKTYETQEAAQRSAPGTREGHRPRQHPAADGGRRPRRAHRRTSRPVRHPLRQR